MWGVLRVCSGAVNVLACVRIWKPCRQSKREVEKGKKREDEGEDSRCGAWVCSQYRDLLRHFYSRPASARPESARHSNITGSADTAAAHRQSRSRCACVCVRACSCACALIGVVHVSVQVCVKIAFVCLLACVCEREFTCVRILGVEYSCLFVCVCVCTWVCL